MASFLRYALSPRSPLIATDGLPDCLPHQERHVALITTDQKPLIACLFASLIRYAAHEELPSGFDWVDYGRLEAFYAGEECGWGLRCTRAISDGTFVVEV